MSIQQGEKISHGGETLSLNEWAGLVELAFTKPLMPRR